MAASSTGRKHLLETLARIAGAVRNLAGRGVAVSTKGTSSTVLSMLVDSVSGGPGDTSETVESLDRRCRHTATAAEEAAMSRIGVRLAAAVALVIGAPVAASAGRSAAPSPFAVICGQQVCVSGKPLNLTAATVYGQLDKPQQAAAMVASARLGVLRITDFMYEDGTTDPAYSEATWARVDRLIAAARAEGLHVEIDLSTYRNLLLEVRQNPYTTDWKQLITFMAQRKNSITGITYRDDPTIALVALAGEPEPINTPSNSIGLTTAQLNEFYVRNLGLLKTYDSRHLHSSGGLMQLDWGSGIDARSIIAAPGNDVPSIHVGSQGDLRTTIPAFATLAQNAGKPWWVEETGAPRSEGDGQRSSWFSAVESTALAHGSAGIGFWNIGTETYPSSHDINPSSLQVWKLVRGVGQTFAATGAARFRTLSSAKKLAKVP